MTIFPCMSPAAMTGPAFATAVTFAGLALLALWIMRQDPFSGRRRFLTCLAGLLWWLGTAYFEQSQPALACKVVFATAAWPGIAVAPVAWFFFIGCYCFGPQWRLVRFERPVLVGMAATLPVLAFSNPWHQLFYGPGTHLVSESGMIYAVYDHGPLFYVVAAFLYFFMTTSVVIVGAAAFQSSKEQRPHFMVLMFGTLAPLTANIGYNFYGFTLFGFDPTPFTFAFLLLSMSWAVIANRMFDLTAIARDIIYFSVADPVIVINRQKYIVAMNPAARRTLPDVEVGVSLHGNTALSEILRHADGDSGPDGARFDMQVDDRIYDCRLIPILRPLATERSTLGVVALLNDATVERRRTAQMEEAIQRFSKELSQIATKLDIAQQSALTDPLTRLGNRRAFDLAVEAHDDFSNTANSLALVDLDYFKTVNDAFGHTVGDAVLRQFAAELVNSLPAGALAFRSGGEEFVILYVGATRDQAVRALNRFAVQLKEHNPLRSYGVRPITFSAGVAGPPGDVEPLSALFDVADGRLYEAKRSGRNRIVAAPVLEDDTSAPVNGAIASQT